MAVARGVVPDRVRRGEIFEIKALIAHRMEMGSRKNAVGDAIDRDIITRFRCRYDGEKLFAWDLHPGVAANPSVSFQRIATGKGELELVWSDMNGLEPRERRRVVVVG
jgi:sulfur-oxidizing protein SoxZ